MKKFGKKIAAMGAAVMMAVSMMSMGASAAVNRKVTWNVTNVNNHTNQTVSYYADGYNEYKLKCTSFTGSTYGAKVQFYSYCMVWDNLTEQYQSRRCTDIEYITKKIEKQWKYKNYIPTYNKRVNSIFVLKQGTATTQYENMSGTVGTYINS